MDDFQRATLSISKINIARDCRVESSFPLAPLFNARPEKPDVVRGERVRFEMGAENFLTAFSFHPYRSRRVGCAGKEKGDRNEGFLEALRNFRAVIHGHGRFEVNRDVFSDCCSLHKKSRINYRDDYGNDRSRGSGLERFQSKTIISILLSNKLIY